MWNYGTVVFVTAARLEGWFKIMAKDYGTMVGYNSALTWVSNLKNVDDNIKQRVLARMAYEFDKDIPTPIKKHKGIYGSKFDHATCGNCGFGAAAFYNYCPNCGFKIAKSEYEEKQRETFEQMTLADFIGM